MSTQKLNLKQFRAIYNFKAAQNLKELIKDFQPEVAIVFNIYHQLSPSILTTLKSNRVPILLCAHDYKIICPNYQINQNGLKCPQNNFLHALECVYRKRIQNSYLKSLAVALEWLIHDLLKTYQKADLITVPSQFTAQAFKKRGWKVEVLPNFINSPVQNTPLADREKAVLYAGRLSPEKGIKVLEKIAQQLPEVKFYVAGDGKQTPTGKNIILLGQLKPKDLIKKYGQVRAVIVPSLANESFGLTALEALSQGTPVVASNRGALPELIKDNQTGFLFEPTRKEGIKQATTSINTLLNNDSLWSQINTQALEKAKNYQTDQYLSQIDHLVKSALDKNQEIT